MTNIEAERPRAHFPIWWIASSIIITGSAICASIVYVVSRGVVTDEEILKYMFEVFKFSMSSVLVAGVGLVYNDYREKVRLAEEDFRELEREKRTRLEREIQTAKSENDRKLQEKKESADRKLQENRVDAEKKLQEEKEMAGRRLQEEREKAEIRLKRIEINRERMENFLKEFTKVYNEIKYIRRELRRNMIKHDGNYDIKVEEYTRLIRDLSAKQLNLEQYLRLFNGKPAYIAKISNDAAFHLGLAENYIRGVLREYEDKKLDIHSRQEISVNAKAELYDFVMKRDGENSKVKEEFFTPMENIFNLIYETL